MYEGGKQPGMGSQLTLLGRKPEIWESKSNDGRLSNYKSLAAEMTKEQETEATNTNARDHSAPDKLKQLFRDQKGYKNIIDHKVTDWIVRNKAFQSAIPRDLTEIPESIWGPGDTLTSLMAKTSSSQIEPTPRSSNLSGHNAELFVDTQLKQKRINSDDTFRALHDRQQQQQPPHHQHPQQQYSGNGRLGALPCHPADLLRQRSKRNHKHSMGMAELLVGAEDAQKEQESQRKRPSRPPKVPGYPAAGSPLDRTRAAGRIGGSFFTAGNVAAAAVCGSNNINGIGQHRRVLERRRRAAVDAPLNFHRSLSTSVQPISSHHPPHMQVHPPGQAECDTGLSRVRVTQRLLPPEVRFSATTEAGEEGHKVRSQSTDWRKLPYGIRQMQPAKNRRFAVDVDMSSGSWH